MEGEGGGGRREDLSRTTGTGAESWCYGEGRVETENRRAPEIQQLH